MAALYEITEQIKYLMRLFEVGDEETSDLSPEHQDALMKWLDDVDSARTEKLDNYAYFIRQLEAEESVCRSEAQAWQLKAQRRASQVARLKSTLFDHMTEVETPRVNTGKFLFSIVNNGGSVPIEVDDVDLLPPTMRIKQPDAANTHAIRAALEAGKELVAARFKPRGKHLRIK